ncbi:MAG: DUF1080 domain-containing protein [Verrucomicrobia bacterium]|nr:MAG: DUF1080 domain-containing protein [Verrucomicrobiota bacterium]TAE89076.1 MAG: DUF1080 domain-containing protein [Verrucomicrobiota bacterium]TAF28052.1 MAG: DUF1080 domain-containing protein [Verrucomicrobiota bacterium]TAF42899.1 MAG: DUF1080 domain-containing protein [Verrucomicrobiota bacterium]
MRHFYPGFLLSLALQLGHAPAQTNLSLPAAEARIHGSGNLRAYGSDFAAQQDAIVLQGWEQREMFPSWNIHVDQPGRVHVGLVLSSGEQTSGSEFEVHLGDQVLKGQVPDTGSWHGRGAYRFVSLGEVNLRKAGKLTVEVKALTMPHRAVMNLKEVLLQSARNSKARVTLEPKPRPLPESPGFGAKQDALHPSVKATDLTPPDIANFRVTGMDWLPDGRMAVCTWDRTGSVYVVANAADPKHAKWHRFAWGLSEPLGLTVVDGSIYVAQKQELTRLVDRDQDGFAETHECVANSWEVTDNFHQFTFGPIYRNGSFYLALAVAVNPGGATTNPQVKDRGTIVRVDPKTGAYEVVSAGHRTPNGLGLGPDGELFVSDNQGDWLPGNKIIHVRDGIFNGHRYEPLHPYARKNESSPTLWLSQNEFSNSPTQPCLIPRGTYAGQLFFGDIHYGGIQRGALEKVDGEWQGSAHRFTAGLRGPVNRLSVGPDGAMWLGQLGVTGNWGEPGKQTQGLQRLEWNDAPVFDLLSASARSNGFLLTFSEPLAPGYGWDPRAYSASQWRFVPTVNYGGPKVDETQLSISSASVAADRRSVFLQIDGLKEGHCVMLRVAREMASEAGRALWSGDALYTLNRIPRNRPGLVSEAPETHVRFDAGAMTEEHPGAAVYRTYCMSCHSIDGTKLVGPSLKNLPGSRHAVITDGTRREIVADDEYLIKSITHPEADIVEGYQPIMPNLTAAMQPGQMESLIGYIKSLAGPAVAPANSLTDEEKARGWQLLFDGKSLAGWERYGAPNEPVGWTVQDGSIAWAAGGAGDLATREEFGDFELCYDWKISEGGNSGVMFRVAAGGDAPWHSGMEMQVLDDARHSDGKLPTHRAGAAYDLVAPPEGITKPVGEWNQARILCKGRRVELRLNGTVTASLDLATEEGKALVAGSKFKELPLFARLAKGRIVLQDHGDPVWFRNVKIRLMTHGE